MQNTERRGLWEGKKSRQKAKHGRKTLARQKDKRVMQKAADVETPRTLEEEW